ncbi:DUF2623 family protein [Jejubacter calystegiae]|uniref:DUF2623 family protein n=1 Tax=Jejubacter calystegiae TaxID=2579935 RepID=A0A4P8YD87_9ENTR|nr:DUF2623 family protein [Jejubacter calystegiae]QCT18449.1 DUF2623 family protein [Jejubacter calystegiae]
MKNEFARGVMDGMKSQHPQEIAAFTDYRADYKRGFILGYCHQLERRYGEMALAAWKAGILTRRYGLDQALMREFFTDFRSERLVRSFNRGYQEAAALPAPGAAA